MPVPAAARCQQVSADDCAEVFGRNTCVELRPSYAAWQPGSRPQVVPSRPSHLAPPNSAIDEDVTTDARQVGPDGVWETAVKWGLTGFGRRR